MMRLLLALALVSVCDAWFFRREPAWNGLKVKFGFPLWAFNSLPRTVTDAVGAGYVRTAPCSASNRYLGARYVKNGDTAKMLLFDKNGFIAGLQAAVPKQEGINYPFDAAKSIFIEEANQWVITAYFSNPEAICSTGRSQAEFDRDGTGTALFIQAGQDPVADSIRMPLTEAPGAPWTRGKCFYGMGQHYWYNASKEMSCEGKLLPVFLMYNGGKLNAFGWSFPADLPSSTFEHPTPSVFDTFMEVVPDCLYRLAERTGFSTLHVYMTDNPVTGNRC